MIFCFLLCSRKEGIGGVLSFFSYFFFFIPLDYALCQLLSYPSLFDMDVNIDLSLPRGILSFWQIRCKKSSIIFSIANPLACIYIALVVYIKNSETAAQTYRKENRNPPSNHVTNQPCSDRNSPFPFPFPCSYLLIAGTHLGRIKGGDCCCPFLGNKWDWYLRQDRGKGLWCVPGLVLVVVVVVVDFRSPGSWTIRGELELLVVFRGWQSGMQWDLVCVSCSRLCLHLHFHFHFHFHYHRDHLRQQCEIPCLLRLRYAELIVVYQWIIRRVRNGNVGLFPIAWT